MMQWKYVCTVGRGCESLNNDNSSAGSSSEPLFIVHNLAPSISMIMALIQ